MCATRIKVTTVHEWDSNPIVSDDVFAGTDVPLERFSAIEASELDELIQLAAWTQVPFEPVL